MFVFHLQADPDARILSYSCGTALFSDGKQVQHMSQRKFDNRSQVMLTMSSVPVGNVFDLMGPL